MVVWPQLTAQTMRHPQFLFIFYYYYLVHASTKISPNHSVFLMTCRDGWLFQAVFLVYSSHGCFFYYYYYFLLIFFIALHYDHFCMTITMSVCYARISMASRSVALLFKDKTTVSPVLFAV